MPEPDYTRIHNAISEEILQLRTKRRAQEILLLRTEQRAQEILLLRTERRAQEILQLRTERRAQEILQLRTERRAQGTCHPAHRTTRPGNLSSCAQNDAPREPVILREVAGSPRGLHNRRYEDTRGDSATPLRSAQNDSQGIPRDTQTTPSHSLLRHSTGHPINPISLPPPGGVKIATRFWWGERIGIPRQSTGHPYGRWRQLA